MSLNVKFLSTVHKIRHFSSAKRNFTGGRIIFNKFSAPSVSTPNNVPGLSERVVKVSKEPVGPGATKSSDYKNPEYFCYDKNSYFEAEVEMLQFRCPQPSIHHPYTHPDPK